MPNIELNFGDDILLAGSNITLAGVDEDDTPDMPPPDQAEAEALAEASQVLTGFRERAKRENDRFVDATDSEFWVAICFQTRDQKEEFLRKAHLIDLGDKYLDGMDVAKALGIKLTSRIPSLPTLRLDRKLQALARSLGVFLG
jgi:hypothetical protein